MGKTNSELQATIAEQEADLERFTKINAKAIKCNEELAAVNEELQAQLEQGLGGPEDIPEHGHSKHESRAERQNRLRSAHIRDELETLAD